MKIYVYWNTNDYDCKKMFHFMSPEDEYSIVDFLQQSNQLTIKRIWQPFRDRAKMLQDIHENDLVIFMTHGDEECILKYRNKPDRDYDEYILVDKSNASVFEDKIVLAFCCSSAKSLGRYCVGSDVGCKAYVGFETDIVYDNGKAEKSRHLIYESYKIAFLKSLKYAANSHCSIGEYRIKLTQLMRKEAAKAIFKSGNNTLNNMYSGTIEGLVSLGNQQAKVFA